MKLMLCLAALLCGCANSAIRCSTRLRPINAPAAAVPVPASDADRRAH